MTGHVDTGVKRGSKPREHVQACSVLVKCFFHVMLMNIKCKTNRLNGIGMDTICIFQPKSPVLPGEYH